MLANSIGANYGIAEVRLHWFPLVRNYFTELLLNPRYSDHDLAKAEKLLLETLDETKSSGFHRSAIAALSLRGQLELEKQNVDKAVEYSVQAVEYFKKGGKYAGAAG